MKKIIIFIYLVLFTLANASGHLSDKDKKATLKCTGLYYANSMIPQGTLELDKIVFSIAAKKYLTSYLIKEGMKADINIIDFDNLTLYSPEIRYDLPAGGKRLVQRVDGYKYTIVSGKVTYIDGVSTGELPGRLIRS